MARGAPHRPRHRAFYDRNPLLFWQIVSALLALLLLASLAAGHR